MTLERFRKRFNASRQAVDPRTGKLTSEFSHLIDELLRGVDANAETANTDITSVDRNAAAAQLAADNAASDAATAQAALETNNVTVEDLSQIKWSDSAGVWPADDSDDHVLTFKRQGSTIATHTIRAVFTQSTGNWTVTSQAETGEATVDTITGSGGKDAKAVVVHSASGILGKVTVQSINQSATGGSPSK